MTAFVLVHGSGQNADSFSRVAGLLRAEGHSVVTPDLPKQASEWGLEEYAAEIARSVTLPDSVVVAHSLCGVFLPLLPERCDCAQLVYLAAVIPEPGQSSRDQFTEDPSMFSSEWIAAGPRWFDKSQADGLAREFLFHDCDAETLPWALGTVEMIDTRRVLTDPCPLEQWPTVPAAAIVATQDRTLSPDWIRRRSRARLGVGAIEIRAGHCPHMSRPDEIAAILHRLSDAA